MPANSSCPPAALQLAMLIVHSAGLLHSCSNCLSEAEISLAPFGVTCRHKEVPVVEDGVGLRRCGVGAKGTEVGGFLTLGGGGSI